MVGEITSLEHELGDNAMEGRSCESESLFASAKSAEVLGSLCQCGGTFGTTSARSSMTMRPRAWPSADTSKKHFGLVIRRSLEGKILLVGFRWRVFDIYALMVYAKVNASANANTLSFSIRSTNTMDDVMLAMGNDKVFGTSWRKCW